MTSDKILFKELWDSETKKVRIKYGECLVVKGKGAIAITSGSRTKLITNVLYVPDLDRNLLIVGQLMENGFNMFFKDKTCVIENPSGDEIFKVKIEGRCFVLNPFEEEKTTFLITDNSIEVWHKRMGHFHHQGMMFLQRKELMNYLRRLQNRWTDCQACLLGKMNRLLFPKTSWRA